MKEARFKIAILASGSGSNAEAIIRYFRNHPGISVDWVLSNKADAGVLERAEKLGIGCRVFNKDQFQNGDVASWLVETGATHIVLAGFLWLIPDSFLKDFPERIINIHPALLPKFGGKGMFGRKVHEAVLAAGEKETGITIHAVNDKFDDGKIIFQIACPVVTGDSPELIQGRIQKLEHEHYPRVIEKWILSAKSKNSGNSDLLTP